MEPISYVTGGIAVAVISGAIGSVIGGRSKVTEKLCNEHREACIKLAGVKLDNLTEKVDNLTKEVKRINGKIC